MATESDPDWRQRRREAILAAAERLFTTGPYRDIQMDELARAAGIGKATLYRYFPSKEVLYLEVFEGVLAGLEHRLQDVASADLPPREALERMLTALAESLGGSFPFLRVVGGEQPELAERGRALLRRWRRRLEEALRGPILAGTADGSFRALDPAATPSMLIGLVRGTLAADPRPSGDRLAALVISVAMQGISAAPAAAETSLDSRPRGTVLRRQGSVAAQ